MVQSMPERTAPLSDRLEALCREAARVYGIAGLAEASDWLKAEITDVPSGALPEHLVADAERAMAAMPDAGLREAVRACAGDLAWTHGERVLPYGFHRRRCFVEIAGPDGMGQRDDIRFGLYLQSAGTFYAPHNHEAVEHYLPVSGTALWQRGDGAFERRAPGTLITHATYERHAMRTDAEPLLALWIWTGNIDFATYAVDAEATEEPATG